MGRRTQSPRVASKHTFPYTAGQYLHRHGPQTEAALFSALGDSVRPDGRADLIQRCLSSGWLALTAGDLITCSEFARAHYDKAEGIVKVEYVGQIAVSREATAYKQPPLSRKYLTNSRGIRQDIPAWSQRPAGFGFKSIGGGEA
ncbi:hypothetical protein [Massilia sp.]|uniref:hypothetical protein n=1 Tax=Massilia sp. TaxID=1882437 RepID=UPI002898A876|nr:hypothetical protein [Massilia sp.]